MEGFSSLLPAMVFHGVRTREAITLRMLNVPRLAAECLAAQWRQSGAVSMQEADVWLAGTTDDQWAHAFPKGTPITGGECKMLWEVLEGKRTWREVFPGTE